MFDAIALVARARPAARFVIIGGSSAEVARWRAWLEGRQAGDAVVFIERIATDDVPDHLAAADILLSPRYGWQQSTAQACRLPPGEARDRRASTRPPNRFYLDPTAAVLTAPTAQAFADGIIQLVSDRALRERLAGSVRPRIDDTYSYPELKKRLAACYADLARRVGSEQRAVAPTDG